MVTKYTRKSFRQHALGTDAGHHVAQRRRSMPVRQRLMLVYLGVAAFVVAITFVHLVLPRFHFGGHPLLECEGVIVEKRIISTVNAGTRYRLAIDVFLADLEVPRATVDLDQAEWERYGVGDRVSVTLQEGRTPGRMDVRALEPLAPGEPMQ